MKNLFAFFVLALFLTACGGEQNKSKADESAAQVNMADMVEVTFNVEGMTCEGCENAISKGVSALDGIGEVVSSHTEGWTTVKYDPSKTSEDAIVTKIIETGYVVAGKKQAGLSSEKDSQETESKE